MDRAEIGRRGEAVAARYYLKQGCTLLVHNYRVKMGEIDLILLEPDGTLVFCEVKTRQPDSLIERRKQNKAGSSRSEGARGAA